MKTLDIAGSIGKTKEFMELWVKFHQIYKEAMEKTSITPEEEELFLQTKSIVARKFQVLADSMSMDRATIERTYDVIGQILSLKNISALSEQVLKKIENDWHESYISLNRLLGHLEVQKDTLIRHKGSFAKRIWKVVAKVFVYLGAFTILALVILYLVYILGIIEIGG